MQRTIFSVHFLPLEAMRKYKPRNRKLGYLTHFHMDAAPAGGYTTLLVEDMEESQRISSEHDVFSTPIYADGRNGLAEDLVQEWRGSVVGEQFGGPGIGVCLELSEFDAKGEIITPATEPGPNELQEARRRQVTWCRWLVNYAQDKWMRGHRDEVDRVLHVVAAEWLASQGLLDPAKYEWVAWSKSDVSASSTVACPFCRVHVSGDASICPNCKSVINAKAFYNQKQAIDNTQKELEALAAEALKAHPDLAKSEEFKAVTQSAGPAPLPPPIRPNMPKQGARV